MIRQLRGGILLGASGTCWAAAQKLTRGRERMSLSYYGPPMKKLYEWLKSFLSIGNPTSRCRLTPAGRPKSLATEDET